MPTYSGYKSIIPKSGPLSKTNETEIVQKAIENAWLEAKQEGAKSTETGHLV